MTDNRLMTGGFREEDSAVEQEAFAPTGLCRGNTWVRRP